MDSTELPLVGVKLIRPRCFGDARGFLAETYSRRDYAGAGVADEFVQENLSLSRERGVVRGLHFQTPPMAQAKLIRVLRGRIFDVVVDIRVGSPTFGRHLAMEMDASEIQQLFVPEGFAHGFSTLVPDTEVAYKVTRYYSPAHEGGLLWNDPALGIAWPVQARDAILADRDRSFPPLAQFNSPFRWISPVTAR
jgi:dTDP-4-dehydrorhamnose 3,5-epimerase